jgi:transcriptional regulator with XRE-family HTH domain
MEIDKECSSMVAIGERIKESRKQKSLTQQELAEKLNVTRSAISNWEVGRNYPDLDLIIQISELFGITLDQLLKEDTTMVQKISTEQRKGVIRKRILSIIVPLLFISLLTTGYFLYQEVSAVQKTISPSVETVIKVEEPSPSWTPIIFDKEGFLNFEGTFWKKELVNHAASPSDIEIRITEQHNGKVIYQFTLEPGKNYSLEGLKSEKNYLIEVRGDLGSYFLTFI